MEVAKIIYYTREGDKHRTVSMKELNLREDFYLEDVFYAVRDAVGVYDLLDRLKKILHDQVELDTENQNNIRFIITDVCGNVNYLKLKPAKGE
jgi:hypothetical protein